MDPAALITAAVPLLAAIGGGLAFLINRADKRRERNEALLIEHLKRENRKLRRENKRLRADGTNWREQLIANDITPQPEHWTEPEEDDDE